jgi:hypothetical protein
MVKNLTDLSILINKLLFEINLKVVNLEVLTLNEDIDTELKIEPNKIKILLNTIERKLQNCEMIYYTYFENLDHSILNGSALTATKILESEFSYDTKLIKKRIEVNESDAYINMINNEFQGYILQLLSLYENIVRLTETLLKKIIVHHKNGKPLSSPYYLLLEYWGILMRLSYRSVDNCYNCVNSHQVFLDKYMDISNKLRNRYIHGYNTHLYHDGAEYRINQQLSNKFAQSSPELVVDVFVEHVLKNTRQLIVDFLGALIADIQMPNQKIPM